MLLSNSTKFVGCFVLALAATGCRGLNWGGANDGEQTSGNRRAGVASGIGEIAVEPAGTYFVSNAAGKIEVGDIAAKRFRYLPVVGKAQVLGFWDDADGSGFYVTLADPCANGERYCTTSHRIVSFDVARWTVVWQKALPRCTIELEYDGAWGTCTAYRVHVPSVGGRVVVSNGNKVWLLDGKTGAEIKVVDQAGLFQSATSLGVQDTDVTPDGAKIVSTSTTRFNDDAALTRTTVIAVSRVSDGEVVCRISVPNCSSNFVMAPSGERGFLAPTTCGQDPVSAVDIKNCRFEKNLPGFGPVAIGRDGQTAVAFLDKWAGDAALATETALKSQLASRSERYHLLFINAETLALDSVAIGNRLPRYGFTRDGNIVLADTVFGQTTEERRIRILDVRTRAIRVVEGPAVQLDHYVMTPDSRLAFLVDRHSHDPFASDYHQAGLYKLDIEQAQSSFVDTPYVTPFAINLTPDGRTLLVKKEASAVVWLIDIATLQTTGQVDEML